MFVINLHSVCLSQRRNLYYECKNILISREGIMSLALNVNLSQGLLHDCLGVHKKAHSACLKIAFVLQWNWQECH